MEQSRLHDADAATNANVNPVVLDSRGEPPNGLFGIDGEDYKLTLKDEDGTTIWTVDDVFLPRGDTLQTADEISASVTPVNLQYDEGVFDRYLTNTTPGTTDMTSAINAAINVMNTKGGGVATGLPGANYLCLSVAMKSNVTLDLNGGTFTKNAGATSTHIVDFTGATTATTTTLTANGDKGDTARFDRYI
jgi:polygalacturonase